MFLKKEKKEMCGTRFRPIKRHATGRPTVQAIDGIGWEEDIPVLTMT
jgi:hypothetical protein